MTEKPPVDPARHAMKMAKKKAARDKIMATKTDKKGLVIVHTGINAKFSDICEFYTMGEGFTWETQDKTRDTEMAQAAWEKSKDLIRDPANKMVLLDEINIAIRYGYVDVADVVAFLTDEKPEMTHVVLTGRNAAEDLIEIADLVTEMELVKHPFRSGIKAQIGVEF